MFGAYQYYQNPYQQQWNNLYPGREFPTPEKNPQMFPQGAKTRTVTYYVNPFSIACSDWQTCPMGLLDYKCQWEHSCYLNLAEMAVHVIGIFMIAMVAIIVSGKVISLVYNFLTGVMFIHKAVEIITSIMQCFSFGMLERDIVVEVEEGTEKKLSDRHQEVKDKLAEIDLEINFDALNDFELKRVADILNDYEIISDEEQRAQENP